MSQTEAASSPENAVSAASSLIASPIISPEVNVAGNWTFRLRDSKNRILALTLLTSEDAVFGSGTINDGSDTLKVSASGSVAADKLSLDVTSSAVISLYRLRLNVDGNSASGEYKAFSNESDPWIGIAEGMRVVKQ